MPIKKEIEKRVLRVSFRAVKKDDGTTVLTGMPIVYGKDSEDMGFIERVAIGAAKNALKTSDPRALYGHNSDSLLPLGRMSAGTLRAVDTDAGVEIEVDPPDTQFARDLAISIERGDIQDMSFGFTVKDDIWETKDGKDYRTITNIDELFDFSFVAFPAYPDTTVALRSMAEYRKTGGVTVPDDDVTVENENIEIDLLTSSVGGYTE